MQAWYQGGISVVDFTDARKPFEITFFDRGPIGDKLLLGGHWSAYWYNGLIVASEIARGLDVLQLTPGDQLTQNEIDAAKLGRVEQLNAQLQQKFTWPATAVVARAYLDQLGRNKKVAATWTADAAASADPARVRALAATVKGMAGAKGS